MVTAYDDSRLDLALPLDELQRVRRLSWDGLGNPIGSEVPPSGDRRTEPFPHLVQHRSDELLLGKACASQHGDRYQRLAGRGVVGRDLVQDTEVVDGACARTIQHRLPDGGVASQGRSQVPPKTSSCRGFRSRGAESRSLYSSGRPDGVPAYPTARAVTTS